MGRCFVENQFVTDRTRIGLVWVLALALGPFGRGQTVPAPSGPVTLAEACRLALAKNGDFRSAQFQVDAALAQLKAAREVPNPTLGLSTAKISTDGTPENTALGNGMLSRAYDSIVSLSQLIQVSKRGLMRDSANAGVHVAQFQLDDARRLLLQAVTQSYVAALSAEEQAKVLGLSASALRREAEVAAHRYQAGDLSKSDQSRGSRSQPSRTTRRRVGRSHGKGGRGGPRIAHQCSRAPRVTALADTLGQLAGTAPTNSEEAIVLKRPDIAAAEAALEQADLNVRLARHQRVPDVTLSLQYERNPPAQPDTVSVRLSLPPARLEPIQRRDLGRDGGPKPGRGPPRSESGFRPARMSQQRGWPTARPWLARKRKGAWRVPR